MEPTSSDYLQAEFPDNIIKRPPNSADRKPADAASLPSHNRFAILSSDTPPYVTPKDDIHLYKRRSSSSVQTNEPAVAGAGYGRRRGHSIHNITTLPYSSSPSPASPSFGTRPILRGPQTVSYLDTKLSGLELDQSSSSGISDIQEALKQILTNQQEMKRDMEEMKNDTKVQNDKYMEELPVLIDHSVKKQLAAVVQETLASMKSSQLQDSNASQSLLTQTHPGKTAESDRKLFMSMSLNASMKSYEKVAAPSDPIKDNLSRLISKEMYVEAFSIALETSNASWLCRQIDMTKGLTYSLMTLSQRVRLSLVSQLADDIREDTKEVLDWIGTVLMSIDLSDTSVVNDIRQVLSDVIQKLRKGQRFPMPSNVIAAKRIRTAVCMIECMLKSLPVYP